MAIDEQAFDRALKQAGSEGLREYFATFILAYEQHRSHAQPKPLERTTRERMIDVYFQLLRLQ